MWGWSTHLRVGWGPILSSKARVPSSLRREFWAVIRSITIPGRSLQRVSHNNHIPGCSQDGNNPRGTANNGRRVPSSARQVQWGRPLPSCCTCPFWGMGPRHAHLIHPWHTELLPPWQQAQRRCWISLGAKGSPHGCDDVFPDRRSEVSLGSEWLLHRPWEPPVFNKPRCSLCPAHSSFPQ